MVKPTCTPPAMCCDGTDVEVYAFDDLYLVKGATCVSGGRRVLSRRKDGTCLLWDRANHKCADPNNRPLKCKESVR